MSRWFQDRAWALKDESDLSERRQDVRHEQRGQKQHVGKTQATSRSPWGLLGAGESERLEAPGCGGSCRSGQVTADQDSRGSPRVVTGEATLERLYGKAGPDRRISSRRKWAGSYHRPGEKRR